MPATRRMVNPLLNETVSGRSHTACEDRRELNPNEYLGPGSTACGLFTAVRLLIQMIASAHRAKLFAHVLEHCRLGGLAARWSIPCDGRARRGQARDEPFLA
jgi:hypothetical protein